jgi:hypothetical protein
VVIFKLSTKHLFILFSKLRLNLKGVSCNKSGNSCYANSYKKELITYKLLKPTVPYTSPISEVVKPIPPSFLPSSKNGEAILTNCVSPNL